MNLIIKTVAKRRVLLIILVFLNVILHAQSIEQQAPEKGDNFKAGYRGMVEFGFQFGIKERNADRIKFNFINSYQAIPQFSIGIGVGMRYYLNKNMFLIPLFGNFKVNFINKKVSPFISVDIGYSFNASNDFKNNGMILSPRIGANFKMSDKTSFDIGIDYEMQLIPYHYYFFNRRSTTTQNFGALGIHLGVRF